MGWGEGEGGGVGWEWIDACMFGAMIASTDAMAIVFIIKTSEWGWGGG